MYDIETRISFTITITTVSKLIDYTHSIHMFSNLQCMRYFM